MRYWFHDFQFLFKWGQQKIKICLQQRDSRILVYVYILFSLMLHKKNTGGTDDKTPNSFRLLN